MLTRKKKQEAALRQHLKEAQKVCWEFSIDAEIYSNEYVIKQKWRAGRNKIRKLKARTRLYEELLFQRIREGIEKKISRYHSYGDLEVMVEGMPKNIWKRMMRTWTTFTPLRKRKNYEKYKKTHKASVFLQNFPGVQLLKKVGSKEMMKITIERKVAARAIYNQSESKMVLTFWYEPYLFPEGWILNYRGDSNKGRNCKHKTYFLEKII